MMGFAKTREECLVVVRGRKFLPVYSRFVCGAVVGAWSLGHWWGMCSGCKWYGGIMNEFERIILRFRHSAIVAYALTVGAEVGVPPDARAEVDILVLWVASLLGSLNFLFHLRAGMRSTWAVHFLKVESDHFMMSIL